MLNNLIYMHTLNTVAASGGCEGAIRGLVEPGGFADFFKDIAVKGFAGGATELFRAFFDGLFGPLAALARPLFAAFLEKVGGRGAVDQLTQKLLEFVQRARAAAQCLNRHDDVWKEAAERAGVDVDTLKHVVGLLAGKGEDEIRRKVEELEESLKEVEGQIRAISISPDATYFYAGDWLAGREENGKLKLCNVFMGDCGRGIYVEYVYNDLEETVVKEVRKKAAEGGGLAVVRGAKGIGKSTAVQVALYRVLQLPLKVGDRYYKPVVVVVDYYDKDVSERFIHAAKSLGFYLIFYLDPSKPRAYPKEPTGLYQPEMSIEEVRSVLDKLRDVTGAVAVVVLSNDQYQAVKDLIEDIQPIGADQLLASKKEKYVETLVKNYSGCEGEIVERVAKAMASFDDNHAVAAVTVAHWLKRGGCRGEEVERAVERARGNVHRFVLHYLWYGLFNENDVVTKRHAPLLLAVGLFGPHPPKLAETVIRAFDEEPEDAVVRWFSQPLHGTILEAIKNFVNCVDQSRRNFALCQDDVAKLLVKSIQGKLADNEEMRVELLKQKIVTTVAAHLSSLVKDFTETIGGRRLESLGRWALKSKALGMADVPVEDVYDRLDVLLAVLGITSLRSFPSSLEGFARGWILVGREPAYALSEYVLAALHTNRATLSDKVSEVFYRVRSRGYLTQMDEWEVVGLLNAVVWKNADDEEVKYALHLSHYLLREYKFVLPEAVAPSIQRLLKIVHNRRVEVASELAFLYRRYPIEGLDPWTLYDKVDGVEKVFILQGILRQRKIGKDDLDKIEDRLRELEKGDASLLLRLTVYPRLAVHYAELGKWRRAEEYIKRSLEALSSVGLSSENLRRLLSPYYSPFEFERWVAELPLYVYSNAILTYMLIDNIKRGLKMVKRMWLYVAKSAVKRAVVVTAFEIYLVSLAYQNRVEFNNVVNKYREIISSIPSVTYYMLKALNIDTKKIDEIKLESFSTLIEALRIDVELLLLAALIVFLFSKPETSTKVIVLDFRPEDLIKAVGEGDLERAKTLAEKCVNTTGGVIRRLCGELNRTLDYSTSRVYGMKMYQKPLLKLYYYLRINLLLDELLFF